MARENGERSECGEFRPRLSRRLFLCTSGTGLTAALAGCGTSTPTTETNTSTPTKRTTPTPASTPASLDPSVLSQSPSSHVAPTDGFATLDWLGEVSPQVLKVTTLEGSGKGSLRWALEQTGSRIVVFEVGGVVDLEGQNIEVTGDNVFVAGQTAPAPGITVIRGALTVGAHNVFLQHLRIRPGDQITGPVDGIGNTGGNVIVDHCSVSWGSDESISTNSGWRNPKITFSNNIAAECLRNSIHPEGTHSYGTLVMDRSSEVTVAGNLWTHNTGRHPRLKGGSSSVAVNNLTYNFSRAVRLGGGVSMETTAAVVGNYYKSGQQSVDGPIIGTTYTDAKGPVKVYAAYNSHPGVSLAASNTDVTFVEERPLWPESLDPVTGEEAYDAVLATAGARPAERTPHDERILTDVREGTGTQIDSQSEVGGYPDLEATTRPLDVPSEGLAAWLYQHTKAVELPDASSP